jgi:hypothetical protein
VCAHACVCVCFSRAPRDRWRPRRASGGRFAREMARAPRARALRLTTMGGVFSVRIADEKVNKASKAAKFVKKGSKGKLLKKRFSATFHRYV